MFDDRNFGVHCVRAQQKRNREKENRLIKRLIDYAINNINGQDGDVAVAVAKKCACFITVIDFADTKSNRHKVCAYDCIYTHNMLYTC